MLSLCLVAACSTTGERHRGEMRPQEPGRTLVYECGDFEFIARTGPGEIALYLPDEYRVLGQVRSSAGRRYTDTDITLTTDGEEAGLDVGDRHYRGCQLNRARAPWEEARRRGVDFRAVGQEPGWYLEMENEAQTLFVAGYGDRRYLFPTAEVEFFDGAEVYQLDGGKHRLRVEVRLQHCIDSMSGEVFDYRVVLDLDSQQYRGCGLALESWWQ
jgi:putative lipoprotein